MLAQTRKEDFNETNKLATFPCGEWKADINRSNSVDKYCSEHNSTEECYLWPPLYSQYTCENKTQTLFKFKVPYRQSSSETATAHIAKTCLSFTLPKRQPLPFVSSLSSIKTSTVEYPYPLPCCKQKKGSWGSYFMIPQPSLGQACCTSFLFSSPKQKKPLEMCCLPSTCSAATAPLPLASLSALHLPFAAFAAALPAASLCGFSDALVVAEEVCKTEKQKGGNSLLSSEKLPFP